MATAMTVGMAATGSRAWVAARRPSWATGRRLRLTSAAILAAGVLVSGADLAPNGSAPDTAGAAPISAPDTAGAAPIPATPAGSGRDRTMVPGAGEPGFLDQALLTAITAARASGALKAIEGSLLYLGAKYESDTEEQRSAEPSDRSRVSQREDEGFGGAGSLPPASAGTNGTTIPPPPAGSGEPLVARAPSAPDAAGPTATYVSGIALAPPDAPERIGGAINAANAGPTSGAAAITPGTREGTTAPVPSASPWPAAASSPVR